VRTVQVHPSVDPIAPLAAAPGPLSGFQIDEEAYWHGRLFLLSVQTMS
jgi:hypothetical protein